MAAISVVQCHIKKTQTATTTTTTMTTTKEQIKEEITSQVTQIYCRDNNEYEQKMIWDILQNTLL